MTKSEERHRIGQRQVVPRRIPALDGVAVQAGARRARVADVGCGDGALVLAMAKVFPNSTFHAMDPNPLAIAHVERRIAEYGLHNVRTFVAPAEVFPAATMTLSSPSISS